jgi:hypothetical protein
MRSPVGDILRLVQFMLICREKQYIAVIHSGASRYMLREHIALRRPADLSILGAGRHCAAGLWRIDVRLMQRFQRPGHIASRRGVDDTGTSSCGSRREVALIGSSDSRLEDRPQGCRGVGKPSYQARIQRIQGDRCWWLLAPKRWWRSSMMRCQRQQGQSSAGKRSPSA